MAKKKQKPSFTCRATLVEVGYDEDYDCHIIRARVISSSVLVTIPVSQTNVKAMAPYLYDRIELEIRVP